MIRAWPLGNSVMSTASATTPRMGIFRGNWEERLAHIVAMTKAMSRHSDPQEMVRSYAAPMGDLMPVARIVPVNRREMDPPRYRITRSSTWANEVNPWRDKERLPV